MTHSLRTVLVVLLFAFANFLHAQEITQELGFEEFIGLVKSNHPVAIQADLATEKGRAYLLKARGGFDPKLYGNANNKDFNNKNYFGVYQGGLKIPTWFGITLETGYELNEGTYLNPDLNTPADGLWNAGIGITLGKGLFIDERRAELKKAKIYRNSTEVQRIIILNDLLYESSAVYWEWFKSFHEMEIYRNAYSNAITRFIGIKQEAVMGNKPMIDTLEYHIVVQNRQISLQEASLNFQNNTALLQVFLWQEGIVPLELSKEVTPPKLTSDLVIPADDSLFSISDSLIATHPDLVNYLYKIESKKIDLRLSKEGLKPTVNLKYNALAENTFNSTFETYNVNNYKWGAEVSFPLFIRKERGQVKLDKLEIRDMQAGFAEKNQQVKYKVNAAYNTSGTSFSQANLFFNNQLNYEKLLEAELRLFELGESSIFMINTREKNYIYSQIDFAKSIATNQKAHAKLRHTLGVLAQ